MTHMKQISRSSTVAFSPSGKCLALGTVAAAVDMSFSTSSTLEVVNVNFTDSSKTLTPFGSPVGAAERFNRLAWGSAGISEGAHPEGLIAGGLEDGTICLWDPVKIFSSAGEAAQLAKMQKHAGPVKGLMFNTFSPNLLASGAADGELCIWDLANPVEPSLYPALKSGNNQPNSEITNLCWNNKVQHILASTTADGSTIVWDLKRQRPVIRFADPQSRHRCSCLQWNPEVATQLIVASDDDRSPTLQLWDLRNSVSPLMELAGHTKGVLSMAWNIKDPTLMLSSGKDNRTICWDMTRSSIVTELPPSGNWNFDVTWCPSLPGIFSTASFDGKVSIHNLLQCTGAGVTDVVNEDFSVSQVPTGPAKPLALAPKWLARPVGAAFGFGGRLVSFSNGQKIDPTSGAAVPCAAISTKQVVLDSGLVAGAEAFEQSVASGERGNLRNFCINKKNSVMDTDEKETWEFLQVLFEEDARRQLLAHLGLQSAPSEVAGATAALDSMTVAEQAPPTLAAAVPLAAPSNDGAGFFDELPEQPTEEASDFFENLSSQPLSPLAVAGGHAAMDDLPPNSPGVMEPGESDVLKSLYTGDYENAVAACVKHGRMSDALVLASIGGAELWQATQKDYMERNPKPYMMVIKAVMDKNLASLVRSRPLKSWRETLALLCTYACSDEWGDLCSTLGMHLARNGHTHAAVLCYICAGNVDEAVKLWCSAMGASFAVDVLQAVLEKAVVLGMATGQRTASPVLGELVTRYASLLAAEGRMGTALQYLDMVPGEACMSTAVLKHRIYSSRAKDIPATSAIPPFPYEGYDLKGQASASDATYGAQYAQQQQYQYQTYQQQQRIAAYQQPAYNQQPQQPTYQQAYGYSQQQQPAPVQQFTPSPARNFTPANQGVGSQSVVAPNPNASTGFSAAAPAPLAVPAPTVFKPQKPSSPTHPAHAAPQPNVFTPQPHTAPAQQPAIPQPSPFVPQGPKSQRGGATPFQTADAPVAAPPPQPPAPSGPPANITMQTVDTSATPQELKPIVDSLRKLFQHCMSIAPPAKKREMDDNSKRLGGLFWCLNKGDVSPTVAGKLSALCQALDAGDLTSAGHIQVQMTTSDWDECSHWLTALKRLIKTAQTGR